DRDFGDDYHGHDGPIPVKRWPRGEWLPPQSAFYAACLDADFNESPDHNAPGASGVGPIPLNTLDGVRWSTARGYLHSARARPNLTIMPETRVERVLIDGGRALGVLARQAGKEHRLEAGEVILSAGAIGSPHLLMLSGIGPADQLRAAGVPV